MQVNISYFAATSPLLLTFFTLVITSFGTRGGRTMFDQTWLQSLWWLWWWHRKCFYNYWHRSHPHHFNYCHCHHHHPGEKFIQEINTGLASENHPVNSSLEFVRACRWEKFNHYWNNFTSSITFTIHMFQLFGNVSYSLYTTNNNNNNSSTQARMEPEMDIFPEKKKKKKAEKVKLFCI